MYRHLKYGQLFLAPNTGGGSGGGSAATAQSSGTTGESAGGTNADDPWSKIDLDNLDDDSRKAIELVKGQFATLQTTLDQKDQQARQFQSRADATAAELDKLKKGLGVALGGDLPVVPSGPPAQYVANVEQQLLANGVQPAAAKAQAPVMANLLYAQEEAIMKRVGQGVAPVANMVMNHAAEQAFNYARATDATGAMAIPEVAQAVWNSVIEIAQSGTPVTNETVTNLKGMHFMAHAEKNPAVFATLQMNRVPGVPNAPLPPGVRTPVTVSTGGFNYPGANFAPLGGQVTDPNAPRTTLDPGTKVALESVFRLMAPNHKLQ